jgi:hypothetical protein
MSMLSVHVPQTMRGMFSVREVGLTSGQLDLPLLEAAVAFARGIEGLMLPLPELAEPVHAWALLRLADKLGDKA